MEKVYGNNNHCIMCGSEIPEGRQVCPICAWKIKSKAIVKIKLDEGATMPKRAHPEDAGLDLFAKDSKIVPAGGSAIFDTGVHIELPEYSVAMVKSKSGLNVKASLLSEGVIDEGYSGSIVVKLYNHGETDYEVKAGDKISQLVILPIFTPMPVLVDEIEEKGRGNKGFGSTGR